MPGGTSLDLVLGSEQSKRRTWIVRQMWSLSFTEAEWYTAAARQRSKDRTPNVPVDGQGQKPNVGLLARNSSRLFE